MEEIARIGKKLNYKLLLTGNAPDHCFTAVDGEYRAQNTSPNIRK
jgi:hypothetical protein